jgi:glycosyltransferase involved in cell wall biosynthesis
MKILFDHQIHSFVRYGGVSKYFFELMNYYHLKKIQFDVSIKYSNNEDLAIARFVTTKSFLNGIQFPRKGLLLGSINSIESRKLLKKGDFDVFHPTYFDKYFLRYIGNKPFVITIYDMIPELFPDASFLGRVLIKNKRILMGKSSKIIAISQSTKNDILQLMDCDGSKIEVVHLGINSPLPQYRDLNTPGKYILFVGNRGGYKNFDVMLRAIAPILRYNQDVSLVCAGSSRFNDFEINSFKKLNIYKQVYHIPVNNSTLPIIYGKALFFIFPSLYEGFGIPILEAFSNSCPVILSNCSSFPEVAGDAADYFDPRSEESIRMSVTKLLDDEKLRDNMRERGLERVKEFSAENMAEKTLDVYRSVL